MYHQVTAYDCVTSYVVVDMKAVLNNLAAGKIWHTNRHFGVMRRAIQTCGCTVFYFIRWPLEFVMFSISPLLITLSLDLISYRHVKPEIIVALCFLSIGR